MSEILQLKMPLSKEDIKNLRIGDTFELSGDIITGRDAAHKRIRDTLAKGEPLPMDFNGQIVFYAGPCPPKPGKAIGSVAPTTSMRMDAFVEMTFQVGMIGMIGKGERSDYVPELCKKYGGLYLLSIGGASALISNQVVASEVVAYEDLGTESIKRLTVEKLRLIVGIDTKGGVFHTEQRNKYKIV
jgi:fumarate hydratase subunit beta